MLRPKTAKCPSKETNWLSPMSLSNCSQWLYTLKSHDIFHVPNQTWISRSSNYHICGIHFLCDPHYVFLIIIFPCRLPPFLTDGIHAFTSYFPVWLLNEMLRELKWDWLLLCFTFSLSAFSNFPNLLNLRIQMLRNVIGWMFICWNLITNMLVLESGDLQRWLGHKRD